ncbi:hypothetical protein Tco_1111551 [Tanacetum coccineum]|uniref:Uncharacterized protein n=1 Tax=Tanacetum coccineum TaxID=301880 RepID=A0ABQ5IPE1_9ASTR
MQRSYSTLNVFVYKGRVHRIVRKQDNEGRSPYGAAIFQIVGILINMASRGASGNLGDCEYSLSFEYVNCCKLRVNESIGYWGQDTVLELDIQGVKKQFTMLQTCPGVNIVFKVGLPLLKYCHEDLVSYFSVISVRSNYVVKYIVFTKDDFFVEFKEISDSLMEGVLTDTENMLACGSLDLQLSLWFTTLRGDDCIRNQLHAFTFDPLISTCLARSMIVKKEEQSEAMCFKLVFMTPEQNKTGRHVYNCEGICALKKNKT